MARRWRRRALKAVEAERIAALGGGRARLPDRAGDPRGLPRPHYEREALINIRNEPERYADLLTLESLDHFITSADLREGMVDLTNHHNRIERDSYVDEQRPGQPGRASPRNICAARRSSCRSSTNSMFNLGEFCRALEEVFSCHVQTNIYLTPQASDDGKANQGFPPHYDNHDVFVMQISGRQGLADLRHAGRDPVPRRAVRARPARGRAEPTQTFTLKRRRLPLHAARADARRRECRRRAVAAHHRRPDHQDLGRPAARIDLRAGADRARIPPLAARRLRQSRFRPRGRRATISTS